MSSNEKEYIVHTLVQINDSLENKIGLSFEFYSTLANKIKSYMDDIEYDPTKEVYTSYTNDQRNQIVMIGNIVRKMHSILYYNKHLLLTTMQTFCISVLKLLDSLNLVDSMSDLTIFYNKRCA